MCDIDRLEPYEQFRKIVDRSCTLGPVATSTPRHGRRHVHRRMARRAWVTLREGGVDHVVDHGFFDVTDILSDTYWVVVHVEIRYGFMVDSTTSTSTQLADLIIEVVTATSD